MESARDHYAFARGIPFPGLNTDSQSGLGYQTPADVKRELKAILSAEGKALMFCSGSTVIEEGCFEVFKKYCSKKYPSQNSSATAGKHLNFPAVFFYRQQTLLKVFLYLYKNIC